MKVRWMASRGARWVLRLAAVACACAAPFHGQADETPQNWFGDPFVQVSASVHGCLEPLGPRMSKADRLAQSHHRAERGTTCFLHGECEQPNAYRYDAAIADQLVRQLRLNHRVVTSSLWVTVQGRIVYLEGCAPDPARAGAEWERLARAVPQVTQVVTSVYTGRGRPPYQTLRPYQP